MKSETIKASKKNKTTFMTLGLMTISNTECKNKTNHKRKKLISLKFNSLKIKKTQLPLSCDQRQGSTPSISESTFCEWSHINLIFRNSVPVSSPLCPRWTKTFTLTPNAFCEMPLLE